MRVTIRKIGNSRGVIIPAAYLREIGLENEVELTLKEGTIVIEPVRPTPREGWFDDYQAEEDEDAWAGYVSDEDDDWAW